MIEPGDLPLELKGGAYRLVRLIDEGRRGRVFFAEVDLDRFDFAGLIEAHRARGLPVERTRAPASGAGEPDTPAGICRRLSLPYPRDLRAAVLLGQTDYSAEWSSLLAIGHPNLLRVYGGGRHDGLHWYAMELLQDILPLQALARLPEPALLELALQAAEGLEALHERGQIHGDVRPARLRCCGRPDGLRLVLVGPAGQRGVPADAGPHYLSPEQARGAPLDRRTDVYGLGALLYRLLTGRRPYDGLRAPAIEQALAAGRPPAAARDQRPDLGSQAEQLLRRMMASEPERRLLTMTEVRQAICAILASDRRAASRLLDPQRQAPRPQPSGRTRAPAATGQIVAVVAAVLVAIAGLGFLIGMLGGGGGGEPEPPDTPAKKKAGPLSQAPESNPEQSDRALVGRIEALGGEATALSRQGKFEQAGKHLGQMADLALSRESPRVVRSYEQWREKIGAARKAFIDGLADRAATALKQGKKDAAKQLVERLKQLDSEHPRLYDLEEGLEK